MIPVNIPVELVTPLKVYDNGDVPPAAVKVTVPVPPLHVIAEVTTALAVKTVGSEIFIVPVTGPHEFASVTLHAILFPAVIPVNIPVELVTPLKVYDNGAVPPADVRVTVPVPPLHVIAEVTAALAVKTGGSEIFIVPVTGPHEFASVTLHAILFPAVIPVNIPVVLVTPLKV